MTASTHNWSEHVAFRAQSVHAPRSVAEVQDIVRRAAKVRVVGARHSFNAIADTPGAMISLRGLERRLEIDAAARTATVDGGITYAELVPLLDAEGWALPNLASCPDFTVAGAVATATHGSGNACPNLAAAVAGLEIVSATGDLVRLRRGEADFEGAVVALGALGIVSAITLDLVPAFRMRQHVYHGLDFRAVADNFHALMGSAYSVSLFTHWRGDVVDQAWLKVLADAPDLPTALYGGRPAAAPCSPVLGKDPRGTTDQMGIAGRWFERLPHARIGALPPVGGEVQAEYFVARADAAAALRAIHAIQDEIAAVLNVSEIRTIAADAFWLSPQYRRDSVGLHFALVRDWPAVSAALAVLERALAPFAPRPHWGKLFVMPAPQVRAAYPRIADFRGLVERLDPAGKFRNAFLDAYVSGD